MAGAADNNGVSHSSGGNGYEFNRYPVSMRPRNVFGTPLPLLQRITFGTLTFNTT